MPCDNQFRVTPCRAQRRRRKSPLGTLAAGKNDFARPYLHAMQFRRVVEAQQPAFHVAPRCELRHHRRNMPPGSLYPAGRCQLREESDDHAPSLPSATPEGKARIALDAAFDSATPGERKMMIALRGHAEH